MAMSVEERFELIKRNTEEIVSEEELRKLLKEKKNPIVYWGTAVTGKPSIAYLFPLLKLSDFIKAGFKVKILLADLHGALDGTSWNDVDHKYDYYEKAISEIFKAVGSDLKNVEFVKGSEFQLKPEYMFDVLKIASLNSVRDCTKAASEVVKMGDNPKLGGLIYPIMQALDEVYLKADVQFGGTDQRKIMMFARENLPRINLDSRIEIMNPMISGLVGKKMSSSDTKTKIDLTDDEETVKQKVNKADFIEGDLDNGIMSFLKYVIMLLKEDKKEKFIIERPEKFGGNLEFDSIEKIEKAVLKKEVHPLDLKNAVAKEISKLIKKIDTKGLKKLEEKAYN